MIQFYFYNLLNQLINLTMAIPYANRKAWTELPDIALRDKPTFSLAEIHGEFSKVLHVSLESIFECIQVVSRNKLCLTFKDKNSLEETANVGLEFRGHPISFTPLHSKTWVSVSRVQFGVPWDSVKGALAPYGTIDRARQETLNNVCTGTISVLMQVTLPIPSKLTVAGRTCFIYYRGQPRTCFSCGESGHQKRDCPRLATRDEIPSALARSSTWGSQAHNVDRTPVTNPVENTPAASNEESAATSAVIYPDSANVSGSNVTDQVSTEGGVLVTVPHGLTDLASVQQPNTDVLPFPEPMEGASSGVGVSFVPEVQLITPVVTSPTTVEVFGEPLTTEATLPPVPLENSTPPSAPIAQLGEVVPTPVGTILPPKDALAVLSKLVQSCGGSSGPTILPELNVTVPPSASDTQPETPPPDITVLNETVPPYRETESTQVDSNDHTPNDPMDMSQSITDPSATSNNPTRTTPLRATDIDIAQPDFGIGPQHQWEKSPSHMKRAKRLRKKAAKPNKVATESATSGPWTRRRTKPSIPPNPVNHSANPFMILADHPSTDLSESIPGEMISPTSPLMFEPPSPDPWVTVFPETDPPVVSASDSSNDESNSSETEEEYTPIVTASGNLLPEVSHHVGPSIPNPPLPDSASSISSFHEDSDIERPGS